MTHFGIIGKPLEHSQSAVLFTKKFREEHIDAEYSLYPLDTISDFAELRKRISFKGMNVTMPYKQDIIDYLDELDESAQAVGAVNVIRFGTDGKLTGYNTDAIGFVRSIQRHLRPTDKKALVLGTGGASKAVCYGLKKLGLDVTIVSRSADRGITYDMLTQEIVAEHSVIVNATPLGMHPYTDKKADIPYAGISAAHILYDVIYNPEETLFLKEGRLRGSKTINGHEMLLGQAQAAWEIWNS